MNTKKILGIVAVLALVAVAFVGAGAADTEETLDPMTIYVGSTGTIDLNSSSTFNVGMIDNVRTTSQSDDVVSTTYSGLVVTVTGNDAGSDTVKIQGMTEDTGDTYYGYCAVTVKTAYYVSDDGVDSDSSTVDQPMSTTHFLANKASSLGENYTIFVPSGKTMTIPSNKTLDLNGAELNLTGEVNLNGILKTTKLAKITGTNYKINIANGSEFIITNDPTNVLSNVSVKIGTAKKGSVMIAKAVASSTTTGAKWVVTGASVTGATMTDSGDSKNVTRTNLDPNTNTTLVGYDKPVTYTVTIPESVTLGTGTGAAASAEYKVHIEATGSSGDNRAVVMKLDKSANLSGNALHVKNIYNSGDTVEYHMVVTDFDPVYDVIDGNTVTAIKVDGSQAAYGGKTWQTPSGNTVTSSVKFGDANGTDGVSISTAGTYEDTLTFSVSIEEL